MTEWFEFSLYAIKKIVSMVFDLDIGIGFSLGDLEIALLLIGVIASALVVKVSHVLKRSESAKLINADNLRYGGYSYHESDFNRV